MIFKKNNKKIHWQKFQKYDYYIFQLKWSLCQTTERWGRGQGDSIVEWGGGVAIRDAVCGGGMQVTSLDRAAILPDWGRVKRSPVGSAALWGCRFTHTGPRQRGTQRTLPLPTPLWLPHP